MTTECQIQEFITQINLQSELQNLIEKSNDSKQTETYCFQLNGSIKILLKNDYTHFIIKNNQVLDFLLYNFIFYISISF